MNLPWTIKQDYTLKNVDSYLSSRDAFISRELKDILDLYENKQFTTDCYKKTLNIAKSVVSEIQKSVLSEFDWEVETNIQQLKQIEKQLKSMAKTEITELLKTGRVAIKPYIINNTVNVKLVKAEDFNCVFDMYNRLTTVNIRSVINSVNGKTYTLIEEHTYDYDKSTHTINYYVYDTTDVTTYNRTVALTDVPELQNLQPIIFDSPQHLITIVTLKNTSSNLGKSIYYDAMYLIPEADMQFSRTIWEYDGGEMAISASIDLFKPQGSNLNRKAELPKGKERLYRTLAGTADQVPITEYAPQLRDEAYWRGLNQILRQIEFKCGLSYGTLSDLNTVTMTATEIMSSKQRFYSTVTDVQSTYSESFESIFTVVSYLISKFTPTFINTTSYAITFQIGDSIMQTTTDTLNEKLLLFNNGLITKEEFNEWYNSR